MILELTHDEALFVQWAIYDAFLSDAKVDEKLREKALAVQGKLLDGLLEPKKE